MIDDVEEDVPTPAERQRHTRIYRIMDLTVAGLFVLAGVVAIHQVATALPLIHLRQVGPGMLPLGVGCIMVVMGAAIIVQNVLNLTGIREVVMPTLREGSRVGAVVALLVATIALMPVIGTLVSLALFILAEIRLVERRSWPVGLATAVLVPLFVYAAFEALLDVQLPAGVLGLR